MNDFEDNYPEWVVSYQFGDARYGFTIAAKDSAEAVRRLRAIGTTGTVDGQLYMTVPAVAGAGVFVRVLAFLFNLFGKKSV